MKIFSKITAMLGVIGATLGFSPKAKGIPQPPEISALPDNSRPAGFYTGKRRTAQLSPKDWKRRKARKRAENQARNLQHRMAA